MVRIVYDFIYIDPDSDNDSDTLSNLMKVLDEKEYSKLDQRVEDINYIDINKPPSACQYDSMESFNNYEKDGFYRIKKYKDEDSHKVFSMSFLGDDLHGDNSPNIMTLPELPINLKVLVIRDLNITELPPLPEGLMFLYCLNIKKIKNLPSSLVYLFLDRIDEIEIDKLPDGLRYLHIDADDTFELPSVPDTLEYMYLYTYNYIITNLPKEFNFIDFT